MYLKSIIGTIFLSILFLVATPQSATAAEKSTTTEFSINYGGNKPKRSNKGCKMVSKARKKVQKEKSKVAKRNSKKRSIGTYM